MRLMIFTIAIAISALLSGAPARAESIEIDGKAFQPLFDGKTLTGWHGRPHLDPAQYAETDDATRQKWASEVAAHWTIENDEIVNDGNGPYLTTDESFGDMELLLKYKTVAKADSGIYLRGTPQVQIWDTTEEAKFSIGANLGSGALWNNSPGAKGKDPLVLADKPFGEWNSLRILQVGARTTVYLNEQLVVDHAIMENFWNRALPLAASGPVQLQTHGGEIRWKDLLVRRIAPEEANAILAKHDSSGFEPIFDGESLKGWTGATENYEIVDGAIQCKDKHGGTLYTEAKYDDFVARVEFQLPPQGNNGLAIRYPGSGDPAYAAFCELQVLDNEHPAYAKLDKRQYHGSAYGMAAAHRGYLREVGAWNFQEVTVIGSKIKVELNGTVILDADLAAINEYMANSPHPGKELRSGAFGFAGHNDPVKFRNVSIRKVTSE
jgi:hypothetical protein